MVAKAASVVRAIGGQFDAEGKTKALVQLIGNTLEAQGHGRPLSQKPNQQGMYDPALTDASADLEQLAEGLNRARSGRLCLYGPPGTGKTAFALWLAERLEMPLLVRRGSDLLGPYVGQTERNIACAFRTAEQDQALLLIDEIDSFLQAREGASRNWEVSLVNEMLTQMEAYSGVFVASTNLMENLDQAALRRFDFKVEFGYLQPGRRGHCLPDTAKRWAWRPPMTPPNRPSPAWAASPRATLPPFCVGIDFTRSAAPRRWRPASRRSAL